MVPEPTFTLDTNCWIAIEDGRPEPASVCLLAEAQSAGRANVAIVAISASERQTGGHYIKNINEFRERLAQQFIVQHADPETNLSNLEGWLGATSLVLIELKLVPFKQVGTKLILRGVSQECDQ